LHLSHRAPTALQHRTRHPRPVRPGTSHSRREAEQVLPLQKKVVQNCGSRAHCNPSHPVCPASSGNFAHAHAVLRLKLRWPQTRQYQSPTSEVERDPVHSTRCGRQRKHIKRPEAHAVRIASTWEPSPRTSGTAVHRALASPGAQLCAPLVPNRRPKTQCDVSPGPAGKIPEPASKFHFGFEARACDMHGTIRPLQTLYLTPSPG
jgi:hypothetical protein